MSSNPGTSRPGQRQLHRATLTDRQLQVMVACCAAAMLAACLAVEPDARGLGTHSHLGLPGCAYLARTGVPCPSCGGTTSLAWFARGRLSQAWRIHPAGFVLGWVLVASIPFSLLSAALGWCWLARLCRLPLTAWTALVCAALALLLVGWPQRVCSYLEGQPAARGPAAQALTQQGTSMGSAALRAPAARGSVDP
jgi:hypothetical protein